MKLTYLYLTLLCLLWQGCEQQQPDNSSYTDHQENNSKPEEEPHVPPPPSAKLEDSQKPQFGKSFTHPSLSLEMIWVDPGHYWMGSKAENAPKNEKPNALVSISKGFWLAKFETTQELYKSVTNENPSDFQEPKQPVENVAYYEAEGFCERLTAYEQKLGRLPDNFEYHLPTESQWEFVAKGGANGTKLEFPPFEYYVAHKENSRGPSIVGLKEPHPLGFYDMQGNISELCYGRAATLPAIPKKDWIGPQDGDFCIARGGSWFVPPAECTKTARMETLPAFKMANVGFRIALSDILNR